MKSKYYFRIFNSMLCLGLLSLSFMASNCNDILNALGSDDVTGTWVMSNQGGAQFDICNGETVTFSSTTATLTCPGETPITRSYTTSGGVLTYTQTGMSYDYSVSTSSGQTILAMRSRNLTLSRTIEYKRQSTDTHSAAPEQTNDKQNFSNSSELK